MSVFQFLVPGDAPQRADVETVASREARHAERIALTTEQLVSAMALVDEIVDCEARLDGYLGVERRAQLERVIVDRAAKLKAILDLADKRVATLPPESALPRLAGPATTDMESERNRDQAGLGENVYEQS